MHDDPTTAAAERERQTSSPRLSVIIPVHNSAATLTNCLRAVVRAAGPFDEIIVADDGSTDGAIEALDPILLGSVKVVGSPVNIGRGPIRNLGVEAGTGEILVFIDSDVAVDGSALDRIRTAFAASPARVALIGSYDDHPGDPGLVSSYRNLLHHHIHHTHGDTATHFWTGIGAVRRDVFVELGGLDARRWARNMEDVEFGHRLVDAGHSIDVIPEICGTHHKRFTLRSMVAIDLWQRAIPWSHLMIVSGLRIDSFVISPVQVVSGVLVASFLAALAIAPFAPVAGWVALGALLLFVVVNASLWRTMWRSRGPLFAAVCIPLHMLQTAVSGLGFAIAVAQRVRRRYFPANRKR